jgi:hypothetical protein
MSAEHLDYYLDEFTFRFNRRTSRARGLLFYRLAQQAVRTDPHSYKSCSEANARLNVVTGANAIPLLPMYAVGTEPTSAQIAAPDPSFCHREAQHNGGSRAPEGHHDQRARLAR